MSYMGWLRDGTWLGGVKDGVLSGSKVSCSRFQETAKSETKRIRSLILGHFLFPARYLLFKIIGSKMTRNPLAEKRTRLLVGSEAYTLSVQPVFSVLRADQVMYW